MKKICVILLCVLVCISFIFVYNNHCKENIKDINTYGVSVQSVKHISFDTLTTVQLDSVIVADTLPTYNDWTKTYIKDGENNKQYEYGLLYNRQNGVIYTVKQILTPDTLYILQKKIVKSSK